MLRLAEPCPHRGSTGAAMTRGKTPIGYQRLPSGGLVPDAHEAFVLRVIAGTRRLGMTLPQVQRHLLARGLSARGGKPWSVKTLGRLCRKYGWRRVRRAPAPCPPLPVLRHEPHPAVEPQRFLTPPRDLDPDVQLTQALWLQRKAKEPVE